MKKNYLILAFDMMTTSRTSSDYAIFASFHNNTVIILFRITTLSHFLCYSLLYLYYSISVYNRNETETKKDRPRERDREGERGSLS